MTVSTQENCKIVTKTTITPITIMTGMEIAFQVVEILTWFKDAGWIRGDTNTIITKMATASAVVMIFMISMMTGITIQTAKITIHTATMNIVTSDLPTLCQSYCSFWVCTLLCKVSSF